MTETNDVFKQGFEQFSALGRLFGPGKGWEMPAVGTGGQMKQFSSFSSDIQKLYAQAYQHQVDLMGERTKHMIEGLSGLMQCREPHDMLRRQMDLMASMLDNASQRSEALSELSTRTERRVAGLVRDLAADLETPEDGNAGDAATKRKKAPASSRAAARTAK